MIRHRVKEALGRSNNNDDIFKAWNIHKPIMPANKEMDERKVEETDAEISKQISNLYITFDATRLVNKIGSLEKEIARLTKLLQKKAQLEMGKNIVLSDLRSYKYYLDKPIYIYMEKVRTIYITSYYDVNLYAEGDCEEDAIENLCKQIIDYFEILKQESDKLGPVPAKHFMYLKQIVKER